MTTQGLLRLNVEIAMAETLNDHKESGFSGFHSVAFVSNYALTLYPRDLYVWRRRHFIGQTVPKDSSNLSKIHISLVGSPSSTPQLTFIAVFSTLHISIHPERPHPRAFIRLSTTTHLAPFIAANELNVATGIVIHTRNPE